MMSCEGDVLGIISGFFHLVDSKKKVFMSKMAVRKTRETQTNNAFLTLELYVTFGFIDASITDDFRQ